VRARYNLSLAEVFQEPSAFSIEERLDEFNNSHLARLALYVTGKLEEGDKAKSNLELSFTSRDIDLFLDNVEKPNDSEIVKGQRQGAVQEFKGLYKDARIEAARGVVRKARIYFGPLYKKNSPQP